VDCLDAAGLLRRCGDSPSDAAQSELEWVDLMARFGAPLESGARRALRLAGLTARRELLEDLMQEISTKLWERRRSALLCFRGASEAEAVSYLRRLAENAALDALRRWSAQRRCGKPGAVFGDGALAEAIDERVADPERWTLDRERRRWLLGQVRSLCEGRNARRNAWILRRALLDGWTAREIHGVLGERTALTAIQALVFRARRRLRGCVGAPSL
jgi:DNA-directed RNA polymerase specialized sigma24 family protein